jgi:hypothetical protein
LSTGPGPALHASASMSEDERVHGCTLPSLHLRVPSSAENMHDTRARVPLLACMHLLQLVAIPAATIYSILLVRTYMCHLFHFLIDSTIYMQSLSSSVRSRYRDERERMSTHLRCSAWSRRAGPCILLHACLQSSSGSISSCVHVCCVIA